MFVVREIALQVGLAIVHYAKALQNGGRLKQSEVNRIAEFVVIAKFAIVLLV